MLKGPRRSEMTDVHEKKRRLREERLREVDEVIARGLEEAEMKRAYMDALPRQKGMKVSTCPECGNGFAWRWHPLLRVEDGVVVDGATPPYDCCGACRIRSAIKKKEPEIIKMRSQVRGVEEARYRMVARVKKRAP